jgi:hypothetical protein
MTPEARPEGAGRSQPARAGWEPEPGEADWEPRAGKGLGGVRSR